MEGYILVNYHHVPLLINFCESITIIFEVHMDFPSSASKVFDQDGWLSTLKQAGSPGFVFQREFADLLLLFVSMITLCLKSQ